MLVGGEEGNVLISGVMGEGVSGGMVWTLCATWWTVVEKGRIGRSAFMKGCRRNISNFPEDKQGRRHLQ